MSLCLPGCGVSDLCCFPVGFVEEFCSFLSHVAYPPIQGHGDYGQNDEKYADLDYVREGLVEGGGDEGAGILVGRLRGRVKKVAGVGHGDTAQDSPEVF